MGELGTSSFYQYVSDDGATYKMKQRDVVAASVGNVAAVGTEPGYPRGRVPRVIYGKNVTGAVITRKRVWLGDPADTQFVTGGTFTPAGGLVYTIQGRIGEKRRGGS